MHERLNRAELKAQAKQVLSDNYWKTFGVLLVVAALAGAVSQVSVMFSMPLTIMGEPSQAFIFLSNLITTVLTLVISIFVALPLNVGTSRFLIRSAYGEKNFENVFDGFTNNYLGTVTIATVFNLVVSAPLLVVSLIMNMINPNDILLVLVVTLLMLVIAVVCIIVSYMLYFVMFIVAENKNLGYKEAFRISNELTIGHKWELFVLEFSFIGWYLLGLFACGVGMLFVMPYSEQTMAQAYLKLRDEAIKDGRVTKDMFGDAYFVEFEVRQEEPEKEYDIPVVDEKVIEEIIDLDKTEEKTEE